MDGSPMCRNKRTDSKTILSKKKSLHIKMIHQVTQLQMQSIDQENNYYFISSHKMYYYVQIYIQKNTFDNNCSRGLLHFIHFYGDNKNTHTCIHTVHLIVSSIVGLILRVSNTLFSQTLINFTQNTTHITNITTSYIIEITTSTQGRNHNMRSKRTFINV